jgi:hypothetical protein
MSPHVYCPCCSHIIDLQRDDHNDQVGKHLVRITFQCPGCKANVVIIVSRVTYNSLFLS